MKRKQMIGSLVLALGLVSGPALAAGGGIEPVPTDKELDPIVNKEAEVHPATLDLAFQDPRPESEEKPDEGFLPELPILLDGKLYSAEELQKAGVHIGHYVLDSRSSELNAIQAFRTSEDMKVYLERTGQMPSEQPQDARLLCPPAQYFEHSWFGGSRFSVWPGQALSNLGGFWNDRISSVWNSPCSSWTILFEHSNFGGHQLWLGRGWAIPHLGIFGWLGRSGLWPAWYTWNDRASSLIVFW